MRWEITLAKERKIEIPRGNINEAVREAESKKEEGERIVKIRLCR